MGADDIAVELERVSFRYPGGKAGIFDVSLQIRPGELVVCIGPSGCGKTTLLRVIADLEQATSGTVQVNGMSSHDARLNRAYGYVFQAPALFPWRTVLANVMLPLQIQGRDKAAAEAIAREQLGRVGLTGFEKKYPWQLSGGMQQRVQIARCLAQRPSVRSARSVSFFRGSCPPSGCTPSIVRSIRDRNSNGPPKAWGP